MKRGEWLIAGVALASRLPFRSRTLYDFDCVAFALGLSRFDVSHFRPHPPGYALYILAGRTARLLVRDENAALVWVSLAASVVTAVLVYRIGRALFSEAVGLAAALMLLSSPLFWTYGEVAAPYAAGGLVACIVTLLCVRARTAPDPGTILAIGLTIGAGSGFRPDAPIVLAPLALVSSWKSGWKGLALLAAGTAAGLAAWLIPTILISGGWNAYRSALAFQSKTIAFSNAASGLSRPVFIALNTAKLGTYLGWAMGPIGLLLLFALLGRLALGRPHARAPLVLVLWPAAYILLVTLVAFGQPGMMLTALPSFFLLAASVPSRRLLAPIAGAIVLTNSFLFLAAPGSTAAAFHACDASLATKVRTELGLFSAPGIRLMDRFHSTVMDSIRRNYSPDETIVFTNLSAWPQASYYLAGYPVHDLFAFSGFDRPLPDPDIHPPAGFFLLPAGVRHLILLDGNSHSPALRDCIVELDRTGVGRSVPGVPADLASHAREIPIDGSAAITIGDGSAIRLEAIRGE